MGRLIVFLLTAAALAGQDSANGKWIQLFNGHNLDGWTPKITGYPLGENYGNTFRVEDGILKVSYDQYAEFGGRFGHLFYKDKFSDYILAVEYRFVGEQTPGAPDWALRNNGLMLHSQAPETMPVKQDFPISVEIQLLGGAATGERSTANVCTPGTEIYMHQQMVPVHCTNSSSPTIRGDEWVRVEVEVHRSEKFVTRVNGVKVLEFEKPEIGGDGVDNYDPAVKKDGMPLSEGYIAIQGESHPTEFRKIELMDLSGKSAF